MELLLLIASMKFHVFAEKLIFDLRHCLLILLFTIFKGTNAATFIWAKTCREARYISTPICSEASPHFTEKEVMNVQ